MENKLLSISAKRVVLDKINSGDKNIAEFVIKELDRLESIIKNYELALHLFRSTHESNCKKRIEYINK